MDGDVNNLIPQMASTYLPPILICVFFVMIIGSLSSTADADMSALSSIMMADVYGQNIAGKKNATPKTMLLVGPLTMIGATAAALCFASMQFNILDLLVFVGAMWGALVFPVIASFYWARVTNAAFSIAVIAALAAFLPVRFEWISLSG
ncbi:sodium:solute symporter family transporter, partial [Enterococcus faecium]|uniref:sodium:solute symporter family transporter n=1 Tax=Enterococcus faecium TaxID=1352 RepID=UPI0030C7F353